MSDRMYSWRYNCEPFDVEYADDSVLLSPSATGLSLLLHVCVGIMDWSMISDLILRRLS